MNRSLLITGHDLLFTFSEVHDSSLQDKVVTTDESDDPRDRALVFPCAHGDKLATCRGLWSSVLWRADKLGDSLLRLDRASLLQYIP